MTKYVCAKCDREIPRKELEKGPIRCPNCGSYEIRKSEEKV